ncbi:MAG: GNAT family N-acetyltransferase [Rhodospirillales bacterium]
MQLVIETDRLRLRPLDANDLELAVEMFTDPDVSRYVGNTMPECDIVSQFPSWTRRCGGGAIGVWCVTDKRIGEKLGTAVLLPLPVDADDTEWDLLHGDGFPDRDIEVGYILRKQAWGRGVATETCRALLRFAFEDTPLEYLVACTDPRNSRSQNVLRKCGLRDVGPIRAYAEDDVPGFRITKTDWLNDRA